MCICRMDTYNMLVFTTDSSDTSVYTVDLHDMFVLLAQTNCNADSHDISVGIVGSYKLSVCIVDSHDKSV